jgi:hypothetical protein
MAGVRNKKKEHLPATRSEQATDDEPRQKGRDNDARKQTNQRLTEQKGNGRERKEHESQAPDNK